MAHVPPGTTTSQSSYGEWILRITKKYKRTIIGMIISHTHHDKFELVCTCWIAHHYLISY